MTSSISKTILQCSGGFMESPETFVHLLPTKWLRCWLKVCQHNGIMCIQIWILQIWLPEERRQATSRIKGPELLKYNHSECLIDDVPISTSPTNKAELKKNVLKVKQGLAQPLVDPAAYSSWLKLLRMTAWIQCFCHNMQNKGQCSQGTLSTRELTGAGLCWIKWVQKDPFPAKVEWLSKGRPIPCTSHVANLHPDSGWSSVCWRTDWPGWITLGSQHPIILDHRHDVTHLIRVCGVGLCWSVLSLRWS